MSVPHFVSLVKSIIPDFNPTCIFEVGSRDGAESAHFRRLFPDAAIYAFEPNLDTLYECHRSCSSNNVNLVPAAVWTHDGVHTFFASTTANHGYSSLFNPSGKYDHIEAMPTRQQIVPCVRLDTFIKQTSCSPPQLVWTDAQGADLSALMSMGDYINQVSGVWCEVLYGEMYSQQGFRDDIVRYLTDHGFSKEYESVCVKDASGAAWWGDACFVRRTQN